MKGVMKLFVGQAVRPSDRPTGRKQERGPQIRDVEAPSLPRGNHLVARTKTSPGFGRSSSPSRGYPSGIEPITACPLQWRGRAGVAPASVSTFANELLDQSRTSIFVSQVRRTPCAVRRNAVRR